MNKIGFGFLRLPMTNAGGDTNIDWVLLNRMTDVFLANGGTYFDTAYTYLDGMSENAIKQSVVRRLRCFLIRHSFTCSPHTIYRSSTLYKKAHPLRSGCTFCLS